MNTKMWRVTLSKYQSEYEEKYLILQGLMEKPTPETFIEIDNQLRYLAELKMKVDILSKLLSNEKTLLVG